jgi:hypothetical protein
MRIAILIVGVAVLAGCNVMQAKVQAFGKDTYVLNAISPEGNVRLANTYCNERHLLMQPEHMSGTSFVFRCVTAADATVPDWRADGGRVTVDVKP